MDQLVDEDSLTPEEALLEKDELESLEKAIGHLKDSQQIVIRMMLKGKTQVEIAETLGLRNRCTVVFHKEKAIKTLRMLLDNKI